MKTVLLTDADTKKEVVIVFGDGGAVFAKENQDDVGVYTEIYDKDTKIMVSVLESPKVINQMLCGNL